MTKDHMFAFGRAMSPEDRRAFDRWLKVNFVLGAALAAGIFAVMLVSFDSLGPRSAIADNGASLPGALVPGRPMSPFDLMIRIAPDALPVEQVDEPF
jgi:hypothetical protein